MEKKIYIIAVLVVLCNTIAFSQALDSLSVNAVVKDSTGQYSLSAVLDEVVVKGVRPHVKVEGGTLIYDTPALIKDKPVSNAFEAIKELPGISGGDDRIELLGASQLSIVLNGQLSTMTLDQLISLLKTIPASRVKSTEIMYNAPARYNVKGALINVVIEQDNTESETLQGEAGAEYRQRHFASGAARANVLYTTPKLSLDLLVNGEKGRAFGGEDMFARHTLNNNIVEVNQINRGKNNPQSGTLRAGMDYTFGNKDKLSASYYLNAGKTDAVRTSNSSYSYRNENETSSAFSTTSVDGNSTLQNAQVQYKGHSGIIAGMDYTNYRSPEQQHFVNNAESESTDMLNDSKQNISKYMAFANHTVTIKSNWALNYGINGSYTASKTKVGYSYKNGTDFIPDEDNNLNDKQTEYGGNLFAELSHTFGKFSATVSLKGEYFKSEYTSNGRKSVLWDDFAFFPGASLSYTFSPRHILQFNLSSEKDYPSYWSINPQTTYLNAYSVIVGNPSLKPSRLYEGQLLYIFRQKYILMAFAQYEPDHFAQFSWQSDTELKTIFRFVNSDFQVITGMGAIIPVNIGSRVSTKITLQGMRLQEKNDSFYDIPFNISKYVGRIAVDNTINISNAKPNLKLTLNGYYVSPAIQGTMKLSRYYDVSGGLKWTFAADKATLSLNYSNIFRSNIPNPIKVDMGRQYSRMSSIYDSLLGISFSWKFGGYKEKKHEKPDDSRFGK